MKEKTPLSKFAKFKCFLITYKDSQLKLISLLIFITKRFFFTSHCCRLSSIFDCKLLNLKIKSSHHFTCTAICTLLVYHNIIVVSPLWLKFKITRKKVRAFDKGSTLEKNSREIIVECFKL